jgi:hypothetical protein
MGEGPDVPQAGADHGDGEDGHEADELGSRERRQPFADGLPRHARLRRRVRGTDRTAER